MLLKNLLLTSVAASVLAASASARDYGGPVVPPTEQITVTGHRTDNTTKDFRVEDAYPRFATLGPRFAKGLVIWNNSTDAPDRQYK